MPIFMREQAVLTRTVGVSLKAALPLPALSGLAPNVRAVILNIFSCVSPLHVK